MPSHRFPSKAKTMDDDDAAPAGSTAFFEEGWQLSCGSCDWTTTIILSVFFFVWNSMLCPIIVGGILVPVVRCRCPNPAVAIICICPHWLVGVIMPLMIGGMVSVSISVGLPYGFAFVYFLRQDDNNQYNEGTTPCPCCPGTGNNAEEEEEEEEAQPSRQESFSISMTSIARQSSKSDPNLPVASAVDANETITRQQQLRIRELEAQVAALQRDQGRGATAVPPPIALAVVDEAASGESADLPVARTHFVG